MAFRRFDTVPTASTSALLDGFSRLPAPAQFAKRACNPCAVRNMLNLTPTQMADVLSQFSAWSKPYTRGAVWQWEKAISGHLAFSKYAPGRFSRRAYRDLIITCIEQRSAGAATARVAMTGPHAKRWKVTLVKKEAAK